MGARAQCLSCEVLCRGSNVSQLDADEDYTAKAHEKDPSRTRQSLVTLAAFPPWGSWPGWRHVRSRPPA